MKLSGIYKGLSDPLRARVLALLQPGPLCVCHLVEILETEQVTVSKQLGYLKKLGLVEGERHAQWMIYRLADKLPPLLEINLTNLQSLDTGEANFKADRRQRAIVLKRLCKDAPACAEPILAANKHA